VLQQPAEYQDRLHGRNRIHSVQGCGLPQPALVAGLPARSLNPSLEDFGPRSPE
jgi:hypothetical protein